MKKLSIKNKKLILRIVSSIFFVSGIALFLGYKLYNLNLDKKDEEKVEIFFSNQQKEITKDEVVNKEEVPSNENTSSDVYNNYIGVLEIPKINFKRGFTSIEDPLNDVNRNIQVLKQSDMPNVIGGNLIIAGHSGTGRIAFFKNLYKLSLNDFIFIYYKNNKYIYKVVDIYEVDKTGSVKIKSSNNETMLTLITCSQNSDTKQIVIICYLEQID